MKTVLRNVLGMAAMFFAAAAPLGLAAADEAELAVSREAAIRPGKWNSNYFAVKSYAEANHIPMFSYYGSTTCGNCTKMKKIFTRDAFVDLQKRKPMALAFVLKDVDTDIQAAVADDVRNSSRKFPYLRFYWVKPDGKVIDKKFSGISSEVPFKGSYLEDKVVGYLDSLSEGYEPNLYDGAEYPLAKNAEGLAVEAGKTLWVDVPLIRTGSLGAYRNVLEATGGISTNIVVEWSEGEDSRMVRISTAEMNADATIAIKDEDGFATESFTIKYFETAPETSIANPLWLGEKSAGELPWGEWTMDIETAKAKVKAEGGHVLTCLSGVLWCPWCKGMERGIFESAEFKAWAKENKIALVVLDNPRRSADDIRDANRVVISVGKRNDGPPPTLLRHEAEATTGASGASYLSRKMISTNAAEEVLQRNHDYGYGKLLAPESLRCGYPTVVLMDGDGIVKGRFNPYAEGYDYDVTENMRRLDLLLQTVAMDETAAYPTTTENVLDVRSGGVANVPQQINVSAISWRLTNLPQAGKVAFAANVPSVRLTLVRLSEDGKSSVVVRSGDGTVEYDSSTDGDGVFCLKANAFAAAGKGGMLETAFSIGISVILIPREAAAEYNLGVGNTVQLEMAEGAMYVLSGIEGVGPGEFYTAQSTGLHEFTAAADTIGYRLWRPGFVEFETSAQNVFEFNGKGEVKVVRPEAGGTSGDVSVNVKIVSSSERVAFDSEAMALTWADGESGAKTIPFEIALDEIYQPNEEIVLLLEAAEGTTLGAKSEHVITLIDSADPILEKREYEISCWRNFSFEQRLKVWNVNDPKNVSLVKKSGKLPSGVNIKYDKTTGEVVVSGKPSRESAVVESAYALTERRGGDKVEGLSTTFRIAVVDPAKLPADDPNSNPALGVRVSSLTFPATDDESSLIMGMFTVNATTAGKVSLKFEGPFGKKLSFSGNWQYLDNGIAFVELTDRKGNICGLTMDKDGQFTTELFCSDDESFYMGYSSPAESGDFASYAGNYTVTLPVRGESSASGTAWLTLKMSGSSFLRTGKVSFSGMAPDGQKISGSGQLNPATGDLPLWISKSGFCAGIALNVRSGAKEDYRANPMVILAQPETVSHWTPAGGDPVELEAYGSYFEPNADLLPEIESAYGTTVFRAEADIAAYASERHGAIVAAGGGTVEILPRNKISVQADANGLKFTCKYKPANGTVSGNVGLRFENGAVVNAKYEGVVLPLWYECSDCGETTLIVRPYASGTAYFQDVVGGKSVKCSIPLDIQIPLH